jgi:hypothetical protein
MILATQRKPSIQICQFLLFFFSVLATENLQNRLFLNFEFSFFTKFHQWKKKQWIELWTTTYVLHWYLRLMSEMLIWKLFFSLLFLDTLVVGEVPVQVGSPEGGPSEGVPQPQENPWLRTSVVQLSAFGQRMITNKTF